MKQKEVIFMVGVPGSGKSTYVKTLIQDSEKEYVVCSTDDLISRKANELGITFDQAYFHVSFKEYEKEFLKNVMEAANEGKNVIIDRTNLTLRIRRKLLNYFPEDYITKAVLFDFSDREIIRKRLDKRKIEQNKSVPEQSMEILYKAYKEPTLEEFDEIIKHGNLYN